MSGDNPCAVTPFGRFIGRYETGVGVFRGIRYAQLPVGERRFRKPVEMPLDHGDIDAGEDGPIPPQLPSRLENAMGPFPAPQGEDCLRLTIWVPPNLENNGLADNVLPVLVWFHGGAFTTGAGSLPCYSGLHFCRTERVIVVAVNSRLGPLGYARIKGLSEGNLGLHDQLASLRWIQRCIAGFGGDPGNVTIAGAVGRRFRGAGACGDETGEGLFQRAIVQSARLGLDPDLVRAGGGAWPSPHRCGGIGADRCHARGDRRRDSRGQCSCRPALLGRARGFLGTVLSLCRWRADP